ncbi:hypothetical protein [Xenorhabdus bovienii]|nr:hypothetical protein [Xenorhabdus bovienii]
METKLASQEIRLIKLEGEMSRIKSEQKTSRDDDGDSEHHSKCS